MKISKLFHWLYAILMLLPFGLLVFNMFHGLFSPSATSLLDWNDYLDLIYPNLDGMFNGTGLGLSSVYNVYNYLILNIFGIEYDLIPMLLTYWTCISIIWLVFDIFMYVPLLVHRWIDKAKLE